jgi:hypothetical protein
MILLSSGFELKVFSDLRDRLSIWIPASFIAGENGIDIESLDRRFLLVGIFISGWIELKRLCGLCSRCFSRLVGLLMLAVFVFGSKFGLSGFECWGLFPASTGALEGENCSDKDSI